MTQLLLGDITPAPSRSRVSRLLDIAEKMGHHDINLAGGCVEPGYDDRPVALANWNNRTEYNRETRESKVTDSIMPRLAGLFEKLGYATEWNDEWVVCEGCQKAVRCSPDSYSWKRYYWLDEENCEYVCGDCVKSDPGNYLEWLSGNSKQCMQIDIDLAEHGYRLHSDDYMAGWTGADDPQAIVEGLAEEGISDFIFALDSTGQFDIGFSVWVKRATEGNGE